MNRLKTEFHRLYGCNTQPAPEAAHELFTPEGLTRCLVLELGNPPDWPALSAVWRGVQIDLGLPAPAIAVNGSTGFQLWFSLQTPLRANEARTFLDDLCARYLHGISERRLTTWPLLEHGSWVHAPPVPSNGGTEDRWSAFVAPDLAAVFADTPFLDIPPGDDGQADVLAPLKSSPTEMHCRAKAQTQAQAGAPVLSESTERAAHPSVSPHAFLLGVMNDETADMRLRVEAATALLPYTHPHSASA
jgi:hypothetical protein